MLFVLCISLATSPGRARTDCAEGHCLLGAAGITSARCSLHRQAKPTGLHTSAVGEGKFSASTSCTLYFLQVIKQSYTSAAPLVSK